MSKCKSVLIVEDDKDIRENLAYALESEGYDVHLCENGQVAIECLKALPKGQEPGCIILDLMMPVMDGESFIRVLHSELIEFSKIPLLISTAVSNTDLLLNFPEAVEKLRKPIDLDKLLAAVEKHCDRKN